MKNNLSIPEQMIPAGSRVLCAFSGGADSVCLLHLLRSRGDITVAAAHLNHGIRGGEADRDEAFVRDFCSRLDVPCFAEKADVPAASEKEGCGLEETARRCRYAFLMQTAEDWQADFIATAHNLNDNAETVLLNLARGTGLRGLGGIPPQRGNIIRPLLHVSRRQIEEYLLENNLPHVEDSTNASLCYARNRVRCEVLPKLEEVHPGAAEAIDRMTLSVREDEEYLSSLAEAFLGNCEEDLSVSALLAQPRPVARRTLRLWLGDGITAQQTEEVLALCRENASWELDLPGVHLQRSFDVLSAKDSPAAVFSPEELLPGKDVYLAETGERVCCEVMPYSQEFHSTLDTFYFAYNAICGKLMVTPRFEGDKIKLSGREGTRSVRKLFMEKKIPRWERGRIPVIRDDAGVLAVSGFGQTERTEIAPGEKIYKITIRACPGGNSF